MQYHVTVFKLYNSIRYDALLVSSPVLYFRRTEWYVLIWSSTLFNCLYYRTTCFLLQGTGLQYGIVYVALCGPCSPQSASVSHPNATPHIGMEVSRVLLWHAPSLVHSTSSHNSPHHHITSDPIPSLKKNSGMREGLAASHINFTVTCAPKTHFTIFYLRKREQSEPAESAMIPAGHIFLGKHREFRGGWLKHMRHFMPRVQPVFLGRPDRGTQRKWKFIPSSFTTFVWRVVQHAASCRSGHNFVKKKTQKIANVPSAKQRVLSPCLFSGAPGWAEYFKETLILNFSWPSCRIHLTTINHWQPRGWFFSGSGSRWWHSWEINGAGAKAWRLAVKEAAATSGQVGASDPPR